MEDDEALERYLAGFALAGGTPPLTAAEARAVLDLARVVAHTSERRYAPVTAYLAGLAAGVEGLDSDARERRIRALVAVAQELRHADAPTEPS